MYEGFRVRYPDGRVATTSWLIMADAPTRMTLPQGYVPLGKATDWLVGQTARLEAFADLAGEDGRSYVLWLER